MRTKTSIADMTGLWRVRHGKVLLWPERWMDPINHPMNTRGKPGYVVDCSAKTEKLLLWGQEKKLEPVPKEDQDEARKKVPDPKKFPRPIYSELHARGLVSHSTPKRRTKAEAMAESDAKAKTPAPSSIPDVAPVSESKPRPTRTRAQKKEGLLDGMEDDKGADRS